jgi:hypothetical protein
MSARIRKISFVIASPLLSVALLAGIVAEKRTYRDAEDFEPYHARAKQVIEAIPYNIGSWTGQDVEQPEAAQKLLKQPVLVSRRYVDTSAEALVRRERTASLLFVQTKRSNDMVGHYPPNCYRSQGHTIVERTARDWTIDGLVIPGIEYHFLRKIDGHTANKIVYNFLMVPGRGIVRDMEGIKAAAEDYQQRYYGAAQVQVVFDALGSEKMSQKERDEVFHTLMRETIPAIRAVLRTD